MILNALYNRMQLLGKVSLRLYQGRTPADKIDSYPCDNTGVCSIKWAVQKIILGVVDTLVELSIITPY